MTAFDSAWESPGFLLWHATLRWQRTMTATLRPFGLTHVQFVLLASLWWLGTQGARPSQRELSDHAGTDVMMTSQVARVLEAAGWVRRDSDPQDARVLRLRVTPAGLRLARKAVKAVEVADRAFFASAPDPEGLVPVLLALAGRGTRGAERLTGATA